MASLNDLNLLDEPLQKFIIAEEGKTITLHCKLTNNLSGKWYKNDTLIVSSDKIKITTKGLWHMLEIESVDKDDEGLYIFTVNKSSYSYTKCMLFVKQYAYDNVTHNYSENFARGVCVNQNMRIVNIEDDKFKLLTEFSTSIEKCVWYKNNRPVPARLPKYLYNEDENSISSLFFFNPQTKDSGLYCVVAKTYDNKYIYSYTDVFITGKHIKGICSDEVLPHIWRGPNGNKEVYEEDYVRLIFKVKYDQFTIVKWGKERSHVKLGDKIKCHTYFNQYVALIIPSVNIVDSGRYFLVLRDKRSLTTMVCSAKLNVLEYDSRPAQCTVNESLLPAMVSIGNGVTFRASFNIPEPNLNYVLWQVGHYDIEKSNSKFKVLSNGNTYILHIPFVTPDMNGEICCQLREHIPQEKSILLSITTSYLTVVPPQFIEEMIEHDITIDKKNIYPCSSFSLAVPSLNSKSRTESSFCKDVIMKIDFCRMSGGNLYINVVNEDENSEEKVVHIEKIAVSDPNALFPTPDNWKIHWANTNNNDCFAFEVCQEGEYSRIGLSNLSSLDIKEPAEDKLLKFRIRRLKRKPFWTRDTKLRYVSAELHTKKLNSLRILPHTYFEKSYSHGKRIGAGAVNLVYSRDASRKVFMSKITKSSTKRRLCNLNLPLMEFEILNAISHPNTVRIVDSVYRNKDRDGYLFTMEYLWGGRLKDLLLNGKTLPEVDVIVYIKQILLALSHIHSRKIVHLDIKPQNIMCVNRNSRDIKLIDFGMARMAKQQCNLPGFGESRDFMPPEMITGNLIDTYSDMWSLGVLTYWLLTGEVPFDGISTAAQSQCIRQGLYYYVDKYMRLISDSGKDFINSLLRIHPTERMTAEEALNHRWITDGPTKVNSGKIMVPGRGGMIFIHESSLVNIRWKFLIFQTLAVVKFLAKRPKKSCFVPRRSARLLARGKNAKHQKVM